MELRKYVNEALVGVMRGVHDAERRASSIGGKVRFGKGDKVHCDLPVVPRKEDDGAIRLYVAESEPDRNGVNGVTDGTEAMSAGRVQFSVAVARSPSTEEK